VDSKENQGLDSCFIYFMDSVRRKYTLENAILFGSRARKNSKAYSDYDLILVSDGFKGIKWHKRIEEIASLWNLDKNLDVLPYTPTEFNEKKQRRCIVQQAVKEGIIL
jgi:uncharacterized protein